MAKGPCVCLTGAPLTHAVSDCVPRLRQRASFLAVFLGRFGTGVLRKAFPTSASHCLSKLLPRTTPWWLPQTRELRAYIALALLFDLSCGVV